MVSEENMAAYKIYQNAGFREEGLLEEHLYKHGEYISYIQMGLLKREWQNRKN
jgi:RimJ/RimL family protein N-acetyltransferase